MNEDLGQEKWNEMKYEYEIWIWNMKWKKNETPSETQVKSLAQYHVVNYLKYAIELKLPDFLDNATATFIFTYITYMPSNL